MGHVDDEVSASTLVVGCLGLVSGFPLTNPGELKGTFNLAISPHWPRAWGLVRAVERVRVSVARDSICCLKAPEVVAHSRSSLSTFWERGLSVSLWRVR